MRNSSEDAVDPLSDLLEFLQIRCHLSGRLVAGGSWARCFYSQDAIKLCAITVGSCWYSIDDMPVPIQANEGDVIVTSGNRTLKLASSASLVPGAVTTPVARDSQGQYLLGKGCDFTMLAGIVHVDADRQALLLSCLPPLIHIRGTTPEAEPISWLLRQLMVEMAGRRPGGAVVTSSLTQLLFSHTLRAYLVDAPEGDEGWLKGLGDRRLAAVLAGIHGNPSRSWSLEELAGEAGMSRTSLAVRFREIMGVPPLTYVTQWRMYLASRELRAGASVAEAAVSVGYSSESAFSNAFRRVMATAPGRYRKDASGADEEFDSSSDRTEVGL